MTERPEKSRLNIQAPGSKAGGGVKRIHSRSPRKERLEIFREAASEYCELLDHCGDLGKKQFVFKAMGAIGRVYSAACFLPKPKWQDDFDRSFGFPAGFDALDTLIGLMGDHEVYSGTFNPIDINDKDVDKHSLAFDLMEAYLDLKKGLVIYDGGQPHSHENAGFEWEESFFIHTGRHLADALRVLFWINEDLKYAGGG